VNYRVFKEKGIEFENAVTESRIGKGGVYSETVCLHLFNSNTTHW
jgi:hypothetical protein